VVAANAKALICELEAQQPFPERSPEPESGPQALRVAGALLELGDRRDGIAAPQHRRRDG